MLGWCAATGPCKSSFVSSAESAECHHRYCAKKPSHHCRKAVAALWAVASRPRVLLCHRLTHLLPCVNINQTLLEPSATVHACWHDNVRCCVAGMDDAGLLHLATHMPQLLHLDVSYCRGITNAGVARAREAAADCSEHGMVIITSRYMYP
jgi:hypothetical protein